MATAISPWSWTIWLLALFSSSSNLFFCDSTSVRSAIICSFTSSSFLPSSSFSVCSSSTLELASSKETRTCDNSSVAVVNSSIRERMRSLASFNSLSLLEPCAFWISSFACSRHCRADAKSSWSCWIWLPATRSSCSSFSFSVSSSIFTAKSCSFSCSSFLLKSSSMEHASALEFISVKSSRVLVNSSAAAARSSIKLRIRSFALTSSSCCSPPTSCIFWMTDSASSSDSRASVNSEVDETKFSWSWRICSAQFSSSTSDFFFWDSSSALKASICSAYSSNFSLISSSSSSECRVFDFVLASINIWRVLDNSSETAASSSAMERIFSQVPDSSSCCSLPTSWSFWMTFWASSRDSFASVNSEQVDASSSCSWRIWLLALRRSCSIFVFSATRTSFGLERVWSAISELTSKEHCSMVMEWLSSIVQLLGSCPGVEDLLTILACSFSSATWFSAACNWLLRLSFSPLKTSNSSS